VLTRELRFLSSNDFVAFEHAHEEAVARTRIWLLSSCVMGRHGPLVAWLEVDGSLSKLVGWLT
jgi:hypothetical protein